jgi:hypothetical protein
MLCLRQVISTVILRTSFHRVYVTVFVYLCLVLQKLPFRFLNQSIKTISSYFPSCYMSHQSHLSLLNQPSNIKWLTFLSFSICNFLHTNIILCFSQILFSVLVLNCIPHYSGLEVVYWHLVPKFVGSHPAEAVEFLGRKLRREVKLSVPCHSFTACKRSLM